MIKSKNYGKITEIYRKIPLKTLKNLPPSFPRRWGGGGSGFAGQGGFFRFFDDRGDFRLIPLIYLCSQVIFQSKYFAK